MWNIKKKTCRSSTFLFLVSISHFNSQQPPNSFLQISRHTSQTFNKLFLDITHLHQSTQRVALYSVVDILQERHLWFHHLEVLSTLQRYHKHPVHKRPLDNQNNHQNHIFSILHRGFLAKCWSSRWENPTLNQLHRTPPQTHKFRWDNSCQHYQLRTKKKSHNLTYFEWKFSNIHQLCIFSDCCNTLSGARCFLFREPVCEIREWKEMKKLFFSLHWPARFSNFSPKRKQKFEIKWVILGEKCSAGRESWRSVIKFYRKLCDFLHVLENNRKKLIFRKKIKLNRQFVW